MDTYGRFVYPLPIIKQNNNETLTHRALICLKFESLKNNGGGWGQSVAVSVWNHPNHHEEEAKATLTNPGRKQQGE